MTVYYAHSVENLAPVFWETMSEHEERTARLCRWFLRRIDQELAPWGELLGRWHDLGKYQGSFCEKLRAANSHAVHVEHSGLGAALAYQLLGRVGYPMAFAIAGHHTGLANLQQNDPEEYALVSRKPLSDRLKESIRELERLRATLPPVLLEPQVPELPRWITSAESPDAAKLSLAFFTRMLFSVLVDSDRTATAEFYARAEGRVPDRRSLRYDPLSILQTRLDAHIDRLTAEARKNSPSNVNALRAEVLAACRRAASEPPGLFSLTVPTGGGKTLSAMSFALRHALTHGQDRVVVVIPYTSIIEQNAQRYRGALGDPGRPDQRNVLEHHSGIDEHAAEQQDSEAELRRRLATENWDAPIIVTTAVQFFESLFSDHPSRCRKLHRIAKSTIILDEVQTLPPGLLLPILDAIEELARHYGATVVLSTATPPALTEREGFSEGLRGVRPIIHDPIQLAAAPAARRVKLQWRVDRVTPYEELARELSQFRQVLAVVHRRSDARTLAELLPSKGRFHLSALMCPAHRLQRINHILEALRHGKTCRIVSTQLIEAGVDLDLPVVYRALAGVDSLAQSAGRCDREGRLTEAAGAPAGQFIVFRAETSPPPGTLRRAQESTDTLLRLTGSSELAYGLDPFHPAHCELFFRELYGKERLDAKNVRRESAALNFANVAAAFRMIDDSWSWPVAVPWGDGLQRIAAFQEAPSRITSRALQPFLVQVAKPHVDQLRALGVLEQWQETNLHLPTGLFGNRYDEEFGLAMEAGSEIDPELLLV